MKYHIFCLLQLIGQKIILMLMKILIIQCMKIIW